MRGIHFQRWCLEPVEGGAGKPGRVSFCTISDHSAPQHALWWFRCLDTWPPSIRSSLVAEGGDKAAGRGWMLAEEKLCRFLRYCTFVTLTHINLHYKESRWAICLSSVSPLVCVLRVCLYILCLAAAKKTSSQSPDLGGRLASSGSAFVVWLATNALRWVPTRESSAVDPRQRSLTPDDLLTVTHV